MDEETKRRLDVGIGIVGPVLTVAGLLLGVHQFNVGEANRSKIEHESAIEKDTLDFRRRLWLERLDAYKKVAELAGRIVAHAGDEKLQAALDEFMVAYWGTMILVEDKEVEKAMVAFYVETRDLQSGWSDVGRLKVRADQLLTACRNSEANGRVELGIGKN